MLSVFSVIIHCIVSILSCQCFAQALEQKMFCTGTPFNDISVSFIQSVWFHLYQRITFSLYLKYHASFFWVRVNNDVFCFCCVFVFYFFASETAASFLCMNEYYFCFFVFVFK